jgi:hypothetical protein
VRRLVAIAGVLVAIAATAALGSAAAGAQEAQEPPFVDWNSLVPGLPVAFHPSREPDCADGSPACIERTLSEMYERFDRRYVTCDHNAAFGITYIRVTEEIRKALLAGFYEEPAFLHHEDRVFARMYFASFDAWASGRRERVSPAWLEAYDAGRDRSVSGQGNLLMSMNAHINRDFPFLLDALGLVKPDGSSRKPDHDRGNEVLNRLYGPVLEELSARFDPGVDDANVPGFAGDDTTVFQILQGWREEVWRNAERLAAAETAGQRAAVAEYIEQYALGIARQIEAATAIPDSAARDAHCAAYRSSHREHGGQAAAAARKQPLRPRRTARGGRAERRARRRGRAPRNVRLRVECPEIIRDCEGTAVLLRHRRALTRPARFALKVDGSRVLKLGLTRYGRRVARLRGGRRVRVRTFSPSPWGTERTTERVLRMGSVRR